jgi:hypothetical protein
MQEDENYFIERFPIANMNHGLHYVSYLMLRVSGYSDNHNLIFGWTIIPENSVCIRSVLFCICFKYWPIKARELMRLQTIVARIRCR